MLTNLGIIAETTLEIAMSNSDINKLLQQWSDLNTQLKAVKDAELGLRKQLFAYFFPNPEEGTNTVDLGNGWKLKAGYKLNRSVDKAALMSVLKEMPEGSEDTLIDYKPSLKLSAYRKLDKDICLVFDEALITKPGTPTLDIVPPKG